MKRPALLSLLTLLVFSPLAFSRQQAPPTERAVNTNLENAYPWWLTYTRVDANVVAPPPGNPTANFNVNPNVNNLSVAVDSRNVVHIVGETTTVAATQIGYYCDKYQSRRSNGFSSPIFLAGDGFQPSIDVSPVDDTLHAVWVRNSIVGPATISDIYYRWKDSNGWSTVVNLTNTPAPGNGSSVLYFTPQVKVGSNGTVHVIYAVQAGGGAINYLTVGGVSEIAVQPTPIIVPPDPNPQPDTVFWNPRFALRNGSTPCVVFNWYPDRNPANNPRPQGVGYVDRTGPGLWSGPVEFGVGLGGENFGPDIAFGLGGTPQLTWAWQVTLGPPQPPRVYYRLGLGGPAEVVFDDYFAFKSRILVDSRQQPHVLTPGPSYAVKVNNPLTPGWSQQLALVTPSGTSQGLRTQFNGNEANININVAISRNDHVHLVFEEFYTRTMEYELGVRDGTSMIGTFPGAAANVTNGNLNLNLSLFSTNGVNPSQSVGLVYNSLESFSGLVGNGWKLNVESFLIDHWGGIFDPIKDDPLPNDVTFQSEPDRVTVFLPDGRAVHFYYRVFFPGTEYLVARDRFGFFAKLERTRFDTLTDPPPPPAFPAYEYRMTLKSGDLYTFNSAGKLRRIEDAVGNYIDFTYAGGLLTSITDQNGGRQSTIDYEAATGELYAPRAFDVFDPANRRYELRYAGRSLESVKFAAGPGTPTFTMTYYGANLFPQFERVNMISAFQMPRGNSWTCRWLPDNRFSTVQDPQSSILDEGVVDTMGPSNITPTLNLSFNENLPVFQPRESTVTTRNGNAFRYVHNSRMGLVRQIFDPYSTVGVQGGLRPVTRILNQYGLVTQVQDRWGFITQYDFLPPAGITPHIFDNLGAVRRPASSGAGTELVMSYTYVQTIRWTRIATMVQSVTPTDQTSAVPRTTTNTYNAFGQPTRIDYENVTRPDGDSQTAFSTFEYNGTRGSLNRSVNEEQNAVTYLAFDGTSGLPLVIQRDGGTQTDVFEYDVMGNPTTHTMPKGGAENVQPGPVTTAYDAMYRVMSVTDAGGHATTYDYDLDSHQVAVHPPAGTASTTNYDARGYVTGGTSADGTWSQLVDRDGNVQRSTDLRGFSSNFDFDALSRTVATRSPGASTGGGGGGPAIHTTTYAYDIAAVPNTDGTLRNSTVTRVGSPANRTTTTEHDARGRAQAVVDADTFTRTETLFDEQDQVVATVRRYNGAFQTCTVMFRDARQRVDHTRVQDSVYTPGATPGNSTNTFTLLNRVGSVVTSVDPLGNPAPGSPSHKTTYTLDQRERVTQVTDGFGVVVAESIYGDDDLVIETRVPDPVTKGTSMVTSAKYTYTARKEMLTSENRDCFGTARAYNALSGQVDTVTDALGRVTKSTYDGATQRIDEVITAFGLPGESRVKSTWTTALLTKTTVFAPSGSGGSYSAEYKRTYDQSGRLEKYEMPVIGAGQALSSETMSFNDFGEVGTVTMGSKNVQHFYNDLGQNTSRQWGGPFSTLLTLGYDGSGNQNSFDDGSFRRQMNYTLWKGTPSTETFSLWSGSWTLFKNQTHVYDNANNYSSLTDPELGAHAWTLDANNRISAIQYGGVDICVMTYTPGGLLDTTSLKNSAGNEIARTTHYYDGLGRHVRAHTVNANSSTLTDLKWQYDAVNRVIKMSQSHLGVDFFYTYDDRDNLKSETTVGSAVPPFENTIEEIPLGNGEISFSNDALSAPGTALNVAPRSATWVYDKAGNRTSQTIDGVQTTYVYNEASQLKTEDKATSIDTTHVDHEYDQWGNEIRRVTAVTVIVTGITTTTEELYAYNNHLNVMGTYIRNVTVGAGSPTQVANWQYDFWPTGDRYEKVNTLTNGKELYVPRAGDVITDYTQVGAGAITIQNSYSQGTGIDAKNTRIPYSGGTPLAGGRIHFIGDIVGTITTTLTDAGATSESSVKDAWGNQLAGGTTAERYGYAQREQDNESSLVYMRHRMYDALRGRFLQIEPIHSKRSINGYSYVRNRPTAANDPTGEREIELPNIRSQREVVREVQVAIEEHTKKFKVFWENTVGVGMSYVTGGAKQALEHGFLLLYLGQKRFSPGGAEPVTKSNRFVYTARMGWIDVGHFFTSAAVSYALGADRAFDLGVGVEDKQWAHALAQLQEGLQLDGNSESAYTVEDLPSDRAGAGFGKRVAEGTSFIRGQGAHSLGEALVNSLANGTGTIGIASLVLSAKLWNVAGAFDQFLTDNEGVNYAEVDWLNQSSDTYVTLRAGANDLRNDASSITGKRLNHTSDPMFMKPEYHDKVCPQTKAGSKPPVWP